MPKASPTFSYDTKLSGYSVTLIRNHDGATRHLQGDEATAFLATTRYAEHLSEPNEADRFLDVVMATYF